MFLLITIKIVDLANIFAIADVITNNYNTNVFASLVLSIFFFIFLIFFKNYYFFYLDQKNYLLI